MPRPHRIRASERHAWPSVAAVDSDADEREFFDTLFDLTGLGRGSYRQKFLRRRLAACLRFLGVRDAGAGALRLRKKPQLASAMLNVVLLGVTEFYRDASVFRYLRDAILPVLLQKRQPPRIWSAACSDGQELYSVALLLAKAGASEAAEMLGTDIREAALIKARSGRFSVAEGGESPVEWASEGFTTDRAGAHIHERLRNSITWKQADLLTAAEPGPWDLILWRNMAIYLEPPAADRIWRRFANELRPGGCLVTGKADVPPPGLGLVRISQCIYRKKD